MCVYLLCVCFVSLILRFVCFVLCVWWLLLPLCVFDVVVCFLVIEMYMIVYCLVALGFVCSFMFVSCFCV